MIRLVIVAVALLFALALVALGVDIARAKLGPRIPKPKARRRSRDYDWERRTDRLSRRAKSVPAPAEDRDKILGFLDSRIGVEAYVEPRTVMHPLSVVLVAGDGEWVRVALRDDAFLRELTKSRGLTVHDAMRTGYPERMRKYRRPDGDAGAGPEPDD
jgi:hypothetical protein